MKSLILYQLEGAKEGNALSVILSKYNANATEERTETMLYLYIDGEKDFCKHIGLKNQDTSGLQAIAETMSQADYQKKMMKFNKKCDKMRQKLNNAKKAAGGFNVSSVNVAEMMDNLAKHNEQVQANPKVAKLQDKLDKYIESNKALCESKRYTGTTSGANAIGLSVYDAAKNTTENIHQAIETIKNPKTEHVNQAMLRFKGFIEELLGIAKAVGVMPITDGGKNPKSGERRKIKLNKITAEHLMNAKNREIFIITK